MYLKNKRVLAVILSEEISRFTVEGDRKGHGRYHFLFRKEAHAVSPSIAAFHISIDTIYDISLYV